MKDKRKLGDKRMDEKDMPFPNISSIVSSTPLSIPK